MKYQITRISLLQSSKVLTMLYILFGFIYTLIGVAMLALGSPAMKVVGWIYVFMPVLMGGVGFLMVLVSGALYNFFAKRMGGVEFELTPQSVTSEPSAAPPPVG